MNQDLTFAIDIIIMNIFDKILNKLVLNDYDTFQDISDTIQSLRGPMTRVHAKRVIDALVHVMIKSRKILFSLPPMTFFKSQYFDFTFEQKLRNVFTEDFLVQICQKFWEIHSEVRIQGKKIRKTRFEVYNQGQKRKFEGGKENFSNQ
jgi:hypothetical protein